MREEALLLNIKQAHAKTEEKNQKFETRNANIVTEKKKISIYIQRSLWNNL